MEPRAGAVVLLNVVVETAEKGRKDAPSMKSVLVTIAPAMEPFTSSCSPARSAAVAMTSSVRFPSVALSKPPTVSPVFSATDSVA